ncbi:LEO1 RNA polymerase-associated protein LEO1 [Candida maltosa Xu316]
MSDEEKVNPVEPQQEQEEEEEEIDDLFGDGDGGSQSPVNKDESDSEDDDDESASQTQHVIDVSLPRHALVQSMESDVGLLKTPDFLNIEAHPFDPSSFKEQIETNNKEREHRGLTAKEVHNEQMTEKLLNENTIRWRYHNAGNDEIIKQSNAHFVAWSDGSISLKVGNEIYDVRQLPMYDHLLVKSYQSAEVLQSDSIISKTINLLPASSTHSKNITKKETILNTTTDVDPLEKQRVADENVRKAMKMKRQLESRRRMQEEKWERGETPTGRTQETAYEAYSKEYEDDYDENEYHNDEFVAGDDEEVEEYDDEDEEEGEGVEDEREEEYQRGADRLRQIKQEGASKYREKSQDTEDEEEKQRKRRRIIDSDDE